MINLKKEGDVIEMVNKILSLLVTLIILTGCNQLAVLSLIGSTTSLIVNNNALVKTYSGADVLTFMVTDKDIKTHVYDKAIIVKKVFVETPKKENEILVSYPVVEVKISKLDIPTVNPFFISFIDKNEITNCHYLDLERNKDLIAFFLIIKVSHAVNGFPSI